jgi:hypothetical protein
MLGKIVRVLVAVGVAASLAAPVAGHSNSKRQLDTALVEIKGEVFDFSRAKDPDEGSVVYVLTRNINSRGERQPGEDTVWVISVDTKLMKAEGVTQATLIADREVTFVGYRVVDDLCLARDTRCAFAARQIRFDSGCTVFVGRAAPVFGHKSKVWGWNLPPDGLENTDRSRCEE